MQGDWTPDQWKFIEWLATPRFNRMPPNQEMLAKEIGVDDTTLWRWSKLDGFQDEVNKIARASLGKKLPELYGALIREAEAGSYQHLQLAFEMTNEYTKTTRNLNNTDANVRVMFVEEETIDGDDA